MIDRKSVIQRILLIEVVFLFSAATLALAESNTKLSKGETVYVAVYSNLFIGNVKEKFQLSSLLSVRNTDPNYGITIMKADYYDTDGRKMSSYIYQPVQLKPLASKFYFVEPQDVKGGEGANFIVKWKAEQDVNQPIIEAVMLNVYNRQGVVFRCPGMSSQPTDVLQKATRDLGGYSWFWVSLPMRVKVLSLLDFTTLIRAPSPSRGHTCSLTS